MSNTRLKKAVRYQLDYALYSCLWVYGIATAIFVLLGFISNHAGGIEAFFMDFAYIVTRDTPMVELNVNDNVSGTTIFNYMPIAVVHFFILGIIGIREDIMFFLQHGIGRVTTYASHIVSSLITSTLIAFIFALIDFIAGNVAWLPFFGSSTVGDFLSSWVLYSLGLFFMWQLGILISMIFYRLNHVQKVVFIVLLIMSVVFGAFGVLFTVMRHFTDLTLDAIAELGPDAFEIFIIPGGRMWGELVTTALAALAFLGNYLLVRRAPVKED